MAKYIVILTLVSNIENIKLNPVEACIRALFFQRMTKCREQKSRITKIAVLRFLTIILYI